MSTESRSPRPSASSRMRRDIDPLQMTEAEKRMAEWEARHDVASRGHRSPPDVLQHYFAHERLTHPAAPHPAAGPTRPAPREPAPAVAPAAPDPVPPRSRGLLRRLLHRAG